jgi:hypothetical protein
MIKQKIERASKFILVCCLGALVFSCTPEDGKNGTDGINGKDGINGPAGANGANGTNGTNGEVFTELTKYGSVVTTLTGKRPDGVGFNQTNVFKFTPLAELDENNSVTKSGPNLEFNFRRFTSVPDDVYQDSFSGMTLIVVDAGLPTQSFQLDADLNQIAIFSNDLKYFNLDDEWNWDDAEITNLSITNYSYSDVTKKLKFSFTYNVAAANNKSGNDLTVSGIVDIIVFEEVKVNIP